LAGGTLCASNIFWKENMLVFDKKYVSKYMFAFSGHMNFKTIAELLKTAPVFLKRLESFWHSELLYSVFKVTWMGFLPAKMKQPWEEHEYAMIL